MSKLISAQEAHKYPLLKKFDFEGLIYTHGKTIILTPDKDNFYEKVEFVNGYLSIMPIIQRLFSKNRRFDISELEEEIRKDEKLEKFLGKMKGNPSPIHYSFLQRYEEEGIAWCKRDVNPKRPIFFKEDVFHPGAIYDDTRVIT